MLAGVKMIHVPYKGGAPTMRDLIHGMVRLTDLMRRRWQTG
jgi:tripartite-type tricarboxylate transporter receptor subunit TctC